MGSVRAAAGPPLTVTDAVDVDVEQGVADGGWLVGLLLPRTDAGVLTQAIVVMLVLLALLRPTRRAGVLPLQVGSAMFLTGLFILRGSH